VTLVDRWEITCMLNFTLFMPFILLQYFSKDSNSLHYTLNNSKVLTHSVHIPTCFGGGHHLHQGICLVS